MLVRRRHALALPLLAYAGSTSAAEPALVVLQPLGGAIARPELDTISAAIGALFAVQLSVAAPLVLPPRAFYPKRQRYRAEKLLEHLLEHARPEARVTLGLTAVDISTSKPPHEDWGILGLATLDGRSAVLSSFRCRRGARGAEHARARFAKTAVHELGHSFGLEHCPVAGCLMHDGEGSVLTTDTEHDFCAETRDQLARVGALRKGAVTPFTQAR
jgi:archaemetzincin